MKHHNIAFAERLLNNPLDRHITDTPYLQKGQGNYNLGPDRRKDCFTCKIWPRCTGVMAFKGTFTWDTFLVGSRNCWDTQMMLQSHRNINDLIGKWKRWRSCTFGRIFRTGTDEAASGLLPFPLLPVLEDLPKVHDFTVPNRLHSLVEVWPAMIVKKSEQTPIFQYRQCHAGK